MIGIDRALYNAYRFFKEHGGYVVGRRAAGALELAKAERRLQESDSLKAVWEDERESHYDAFGLLECCERAAKRCAYNGEYHHNGYCPAHHEDAHGEQYWCAIKDSDGEILASLGMIDTCSNPYRRVVEAELAAQVFAQLDEQDALEQAAMAHETAQAADVYNYCAL